jgi:multicomponent Na+:H+ antiporter subunit C
MEAYLAVAAGVVLAFALVALLRRSFLRMVVGFMLVSNAVNLVIFTSGRLTRGQAPIIPGDLETVQSAANPLPQALILTAIVISFGITAFAFALAFRVFKTFGTLDTDQLLESERRERTTPSGDADHLSA